MGVAAPHRDAEWAGAAVLAEGGNALEAAVAVAASLTAVYPHMTGLGGDGFWLIAEPGKAPVGIRACGPAAKSASAAWYAQRGFSSVPTRGPAAALTVAGAVQGWALALELSRSWGGSLPLSRLLADARHQALRGISVSRSQAGLTTAKWSELSSQPGFSAAFAPGGPPEIGEILVQSRVAATLEHLAEQGLGDFYTGELARVLAADLQNLGSPLDLDDFVRYRAALVEPLSVELSVGRVWNLPPPTQGVSSLAILALFDRLGITEPEGFDHIHGLVEATKKAFAWRNAHVGDPSTMRADPHDFLSKERLDVLAQAIDRRRASPWPETTAPGDTVWFGVIDAQGRAVSCIQSLYWEFGSGFVLPKTGLIWQNRGSSFTLAPGPNQLAPGRLPFHTLNPALARLYDGRTVAYGTMGGEGQPQTQAAFLTRYAWFGQTLSQALDAPRWLLGRTWGEASFSLRLENRFSPKTVQALTAAGHSLEEVAAYDDRMGHAGAVVSHADGRVEAAHDPRADGTGLVFIPPGELALQKFLIELAAFGAESDGGVTRLLYDQAWVEARAWLSDQFSALGLEVRDDRVGNLYGRLKGTAPGKTLLTGSHFDTVRHGGWFDGAYGVAVATVALADLARRHGPPRQTVEVVAFCEEEGSRFPLAYWGSGSVAGRWPEGHGDHQKDASGIPLTEAMVAAGFGRADQSDPRRADLSAFVEVHVEQGIVLERSGDKIGVVSAIVGQKRWLIRLTGEANHAGTTPMTLRRDSLAGAAEMMTLVEAEAILRGDPLVATVGFVEVHPNTPNVVPGTVAFSVDARHTDQHELEDFCAHLDGLFQEVARRRGLVLTTELRLQVNPAPMDPSLQALIRRASDARGLRHRNLPSGAGHDSQVMASLCPTAMIFVPSRKGISHSPLEYSSPRALADGLAVLSDVLYDLAWNGGSP